MRQETVKIIHRIYGVLLSLSILAAGICLMAGCITIYQSGPQPYTPESVAKTFDDFKIGILPCLVLVLGGFILELLLPCPAGKTKPEKNYPFILQRLRRTTDLTACPEDLTAALYRLNRRQGLIKLAGLLLLAAGSAVFLCYGANPSNFHPSQINDSMVAAMWWLLPCMAVPFGYGIFAVYHQKRSMIREIDLLKTAPAEAKCAAAPVEPGADRIVIIRYCLLAVAVGCMLYGWLAGGAGDVLTKAVNICTECVGLG